MPSSDQPLPPPAGERIVALLPMRHDSVRVPGKNYRPFAGRPLYRHVLDTLLAVPEIAEVVIDTDSPVIAQDVEGIPERVRVVPRPLHLRAGEVSMNDVLLHTVEAAPADLYLQTHSTNPLLRPATVRAAIAALLAAPDADSLFGVTRLQTRLWWGPGRAVNHDPQVLLRTQDLPPVYQENSNLYLFGGDVLRRYRSRIGARPLLFEIDRAEAWDIDEELDFEVAEFLHARSARQPVGAR